MTTNNKTQKFALNNIIKGELREYISEIRFFSLE